MAPRHNYLIEVEDDGLPAPRVGPWAAEKYRRLGMYADIFATGMKNQWGRRVYIDLYSGYGHALLRGHDFTHNMQRVLTAPLLALASPDPFDLYIFCDSDANAIQALKTRSSQLAPNCPTDFVEGDVNINLSEIEHRIPAHGNGRTVISLCVVDPFDLGIHFDTIRTLGQNRAMDFVILLATDMDGRRNWERYNKPSNTKVERFPGSPDWRQDWAAAAAQGASPAQFLAEQYSSSMTAIGYIPTTLDCMIPIRTYSNNMQLYYLAFFSKNQRGHQIWDEVRRYSTDQLGLF